MGMKNFEFELMTAVTAVTAVRIPSIHNDVSRGECA
jgi:hypothetical protein